MSITIDIKIKFLVLTLLFFMATMKQFVYATGEKNIISGVTYVNTFIENGSTLNWDIAEDGIVNIYLAYDYERFSLNRAYDHWHFLLEAKAGTEITLVFHNFSEIYNGKHIPFDTWIMDCVISPDDRTWQHVQVEWMEGN